MVCFVVNDGSRWQVIAVLSDGVPKSCRQVVRTCDLSLKAVVNSLFLCWLRGLFLERLRLGKSVSG
jgi:hypothetical protein